MRAGNALGWTPPLVRSVRVSVSCVRERTACVDENSTVWRCVRVRRFAQCVRTAWGTETRTESDVLC